METQEFYIGQKFYQPYPPEAATWCDNNNAMIEEKHEEQETEQGSSDVRYYEIVERPEPLPPTHDEISQLREQAYVSKVDVLHAQKMRHQVLGDWTEEDEAEYEANVIRLSQEIAERYPYSEQEVQDDKTEV